MKNKASVRGADHHVCGDRLMGVIRGRFFNPSVYDEEMGDAT